ncbi:MAG: hypothetical protein ACK6D2_10365 [Planctomycetota bacterium]
MSAAAASASAPASPRSSPRALPPRCVGAVAAAALVGAWLAQDGDGRQVLLARALYWLTPVALALWAAAAVRARRLAGERLGPWLRALAGVLAAAAGIAVAVELASPPAMRMQFDETSLLGSAFGMHDGRAALMPIGALPSSTGPLVTDWNLDKRPPLFPFLVSVVHDLTGCRASNAFVVNGVVLAALLALVGWHLAVAAGVAVGALGMALLAGLPLLASCATSAGFEALALALLAAAVAAAIACVRAPTAANANALLATVLLGAQARYETLPVLLVLVAAVGVAVRRWPRDRATGWLLATAPLLLAPLALLAAHGRDAAFYPEAKGQDLVALAHFFDHLGPLLAALFAWGAQPFAALPNVAAVAAGALALARPAGRGAVAGCVALPVAAATAIALLWFYGDVREDTARRLFLPLAALLALLPALSCAAWRAPRAAALLLAPALAVGAWNLVALRRETALPRYAAAIMLDAVDAALAGMRPDPRRTLLVSTVAQYLIVRGYAAATPQQFLARRPALGPGVEVVVLATPLDEACGPLAGDPRDVLAGAPAQLLGEVPGQLRVAAWRLGR